MTLRLNGRDFSQKNSEALNGLPNPLLFVAGPSFSKLTWQHPDSPFQNPENLFED